MRRYAVILAGGKGERFWPLSTPERPKPFLRLFGSKSLLSATGERLLELFGEEGIYVVAPSHLASLVREHLPWLPRGHFLEEPEAKDTAFAVAFALRALPEGTLAFFPADHYVGDEEAFHRDLRLALEGAEGLEGIVTLGVSPTYPATGYGYLERGRRWARGSSGCAGSWRSPPGSGRRSFSAPGGTTGTPGSSWPRRGSGWRSSGSTLPGFWRGGGRGSVWTTP